jgi:hypothetical protein
MSTWLWNTLLFAQFSQQPADAWETTFFGLDPSKRFTLLIVAIGCATGVICTLVVFVSSTIISVQRRRVETDLKREMIDRGMSAEEIANVIEAVAPEDAAQRWIATWAKKKA